MKISMICFSLTGLSTQEKLAALLTEAGHEVSLYGKSKYIPSSISESTSEWAGKQFATADAIIFLGACGIAVRSIAPWILGKKTDPAVLVLDECGNFVISLLSGHLGGANDLTQQTAKLLGAVPVVTTATDLHSRFAVDVFAKKIHCEIFHMKAAKAVSAGLLAGERIGFYSEFPVDGAMPEGLEACDAEGCSLTDGMRLSVGIAVTVHRDCRPFSETTHIVPKVLILGMGCRREKDAESVLHAAERALLEEGLYSQAVEKLVSIDIKKEEKGLLSLAEKWDIPFETFSGEELLQVPGTFTASSFVKGTVGVDNVCERSAVLGSGYGTLIQKKKAADGVTTALAMREWRVCFE